MEPAIFARIAQARRSLTREKVNSIWCQRIRREGCVGPAAPSRTNLRRLLRASQRKRVALGLAILEASMRNIVEPVWPGGRRYMRIDQNFTRAAIVESVISTAVIKAGDGFHTN